MWTCPKCGEPNEEQFDSCWRCAAEGEITYVEEPLEHPPMGLWRLALFACKTYILAVPAALLLSAASAPSPSRWHEWMQHCFEHQRASSLLGAECGYVLCLVLLLLSAIGHDRKSSRQALVFLVLALLSLLVFHPFTHMFPTQGVGGMVG